MGYPLALVVSGYGWLGSLRRHSALESLSFISDIGPAVFDSYDLNPGQVSTLRTLRIGNSRLKMGPASPALFPNLTHLTIRRREDQYPLEDVYKTDPMDILALLEGSARLEDISLDDDIRSMELKVLPPPTRTIDLPFLRRIGVRWGDGLLLLQHLSWPPSAYVGLYGSVEGEMVEGTYEMKCIEDDDISHLASHVRADPDAPIEAIEFEKYNDVLCVAGLQNRSVRFLLDLVTWDFTGTDHTLGAIGRALPLSDVQTAKTSLRTFAQPMLSILCFLQCLPQLQNLIV
ncbi:hypothetical protein EVG20_g2178 [Dentipellis fragilis]|uniref:Uncharacterized protein n=1 Tax=Dentipellis fragilis TaxID=205917 RepID=A0A4Y9ZAG0_9AGAM|nr:hypothetical protein EVG20_g2178 [Dentipellis fragilis]